MCWCLLAVFYRVGGQSGAGVGVLSMVIEENAHKI